MKTCSKCETEKHLSEFHRCSKVSDGRAAVCMTCVAENWAANREKYTKQKRKHYRENRDRILKDQSDRNKDNPKRQQYQKEWCKRNRDDLGDIYVKQVLVHKNGFISECVTPDLIKAKRALLKLKRALKETT